MCTKNETISTNSITSHTVAMAAVLLCLLLTAPICADFDHAESDVFHLNLLSGSSTQSWHAIDTEPFWLNLIGIRRSHIDSNDFTHDGAVNLRYLRAFAAQWLEDDCLAALWCSGMDLDLSGTVDFADFAFLAAHWLD